MSKYRTVIYAQAIVFEKTGRIVNEQANISGLIVNQQVEEERTFECEQIATEFRGTAVEEYQLEERLKQLMKGVRKSMLDKGLVK